jgi:hypothetical protein
MSATRNIAADVGATITQIWSEVLAIPVDASSDFFESGGYSVSVVQILSRIFEVYDLELSVRDVFDNPLLGEFINIVWEHLERGTETCTLN